MPGSDPSPLNPATAPSVRGTLAPGVHVVGGMGNALSVEIDEGILQVDTGQSSMQAGKMLQRLREISDAPVHATRPAGVNLRGGPEASSCRRSRLKLKRSGRSLPHRGGHHPPDWASWGHRFIRCSEGT